MTDLKQRYNDLVNSIKKRPVNFTIGLVVLIILIILIAYSYQGSTTPKNISKKSTLSKIKDLFTGNKDEQLEVESNIYKVKEGDYLWKIAEGAYGSGFNAYDIAKANNIADPNLIEPGQELILPEVEVKEMTKMEGETSSIDSLVTNETTYTVVSGDYLWKIAQDLYGNPYKWVEIANLNNLTNPNYLEIGQILNLP
ncbi:MAG: LysM peptidoglycan-binding domain-containing protein [bacterium]